MVGENYVECENDKYLIKLIETNVVDNVVHISQTVQGIDPEDRIIKFKRWYSDNLLSH